MGDSTGVPVLPGLEILFHGLRALLLLGAFGAFAWALLRMRRESAEQLERLQAAQRELTSQTQTLAERVAALSTLVASLPRHADPASDRHRERERERDFEREPPAIKPRRQTGVPSYETAKRLARSGASVEEIVASCGVAGTEARLLHRLHGAESQRDHAA